MTKPARTILVFGLYAGALGAALVLAPNAPLALFGLPPTDEVWIRVVGMLLLIIGGYYVRAARLELEPFFRMTVYGRAVIIVFLLGFVLAGLAKPVLLLFGAVDLAAAIWTATALRGAGRPRARAAHA